MKKFPLKLLLSFVSVVAGLVLIIVIVAPSYDPCEKVIKNYVSAINSESAEKMRKCEFSTEDYLDGSALGGLIGGLEEAYESESADGEETRMDLLKSSAVSSRIPDNALEVKKIKLLGCSAGESQTQYGITAAEYDILVEVTYMVEEDGENVNRTICYGDMVNLAKGKSGYKIAG